MRAPEFTIDPATVMQAYPAGGSSDIYDQRVPFLVLGRSRIALGAQPGARLRGPAERSGPVAGARAVRRRRSAPAGATNSPVATAKVERSLTVD